MTDEADYRPSRDRRPAREEPISPATVAGAAVADGESRGDDTNHNRPRREKPVTTVVTAGQLEEEAERQRQEEFERELDERFLRLPKIVSAPLAWICLLLAAALAVLFVLGQAATTWTAISAMPGWARWPGLAILALLSAMILYSTLRLLVAYRQLKVNRQIPLRDLRRLEERSHLRALVQAHKAEAVTRLKAFLQNFPLEAPEPLRKLELAGLNREELGILQAAKRKLLNPDLHPGTSGWLDDFTREFQGILDGAARRTIRGKARLVGIKTAASPYPLFDFLIVLSANFQILSRLLVIYQLRMGTVSTCVTLTQIFLNSLLSAQLDSAEELAGDELAHHVGDGILAEVGARVFSKSAKGLFNYLLLKRLSRRTMRLLQPVAVHG